jgi:hypothetical protein
MVGSLSFWQKAAIVGAAPIAGASAGFVVLSQALACAGVAQSQHLSGEFS